MRQTVCFYCVSTGLGGAERSLLELAEELKRTSRYDPVLLLPKPDGPLVPILDEKGIAYDTMEMPAAFLRMSRKSHGRSALLLLRSIVPLVRYLSRVRSWLLEHRPALMDTNGIKCHLLGAFLGASCGVPVIWHMRDIVQRGLVRALLRTTARFCKVRVICNSAATQAALGMGRRSTVIHNGISLRHYVANPNMLLKRKLGVPDRVPLIGLVSMMTRWKGQLEFIQMAELLVAEDCNAHFVIVGSPMYDTFSDDEYERTVLEEIKKRNLENRVRVVPFDRDVVSILNGLDLLIHAATQPEPFGRVIIEAMACGVPVIAPAEGGVVEIVRPGEDGLLFQPRNVTAMKEAVLTFLREPALANACARSGRIRVEQHFTIEAMVQKTEADYDAFLSTRRVEAKP